MDDPKIFTDFDDIPGTLASLMDNFLCFSFTKNLLIIHKLFTNF